MSNSMGLKSDSHGRHSRLAVIAICVHGRDRGAEGAPDFTTVELVTEGVGPRHNSLRMIRSGKRKAADRSPRLSFSVNPAKD